MLSQLNTKNRTVVYSIIEGRSVYPLLISSQIVACEGEEGD